MGIGSATGENRATDAANAAVSSPLLETTLDGATGVLLNITGGSNLGLDLLIAGLLPGQEQSVDDPQLCLQVEFEIREIDHEGVDSVVIDADVAEPQKLRKNGAVLVVGESDAYHRFSCLPVRSEAETEQT